MLGNNTASDSWMLKLICQDLFDSEFFLQMSVMKTDHRIEGFPEELS